MIPVKRDAVRRIGAKVTDQRFDNDEWLKRLLIVGNISVFIDKELTNIPKTTDKIDRKTGEKDIVKPGSRIRCE
jgi:hypothetical protein